MQASKSKGLLFPATVAFTVSVSTLLLQLVQTRIYGVVFWNHLVYFIISIALLGFGISGTWLSFGRNTWLARVLTLQNSAFGFVLATLLSTLFVPQIAISSGEVMASSTRMLQLMGTYCVAVVPYFFAGWMLGTTFRDYVKHIHFLYFADLIGAGLGCLLFLVAMRPVGAINLVLVVCAIVALPVFVYDIRRRSTQAWAVVSVVLLVVLGFYADAINARIVPEPTKAFMALYQDVAPEDKVVEVSEWNPISRIDVVSTKQNPNVRRVFIDGDAWTGIVGSAKVPPAPFDRDRDELLTHQAPYFFDRGPKHSALVIGSGGGVDVLMALRGGVEQIDAIEINPTTYNVMLTKYKDATRGLMTYPGVHAYMEEGRSFIRRSGKTYDVIMLHGIDTFAALNAGAYVLSENYLYTKDAFKDYYAHLSDNGILCITRWLHTPETSRLFIVALEALYDLNVPNPERHIILHSGKGGGAGGTILVSRTPFTEEEIAAFTAQAKKHEGAVYYPQLDPKFDRISAIVRTYLDARAEGTQGAYLASLSMNLSPVTDDSPFFFHFDKVSDMMAVLHEHGAVNLIRGHWASFTLVSLLLLTAIVVVVFMVLPLLRRGRPAVPGFGSWLLYFSCLGVSFIFVEIALMQRFALLLGHPSRSLALVLASLLIFAGVGSQLRGKLNISLSASLVLLVGCILAAAYVYPKVIVAALGWSLAGRAIVTVALVAPLGIFMGMPFPSGLRLVSECGGDAVPWMWGVNGGTTVLGSVLAIIFAIWFSFTTVLILAALGYTLALLLHLRLWRLPVPTRQAETQATPSVSDAKVTSPAQT